MTFVLPPPSLLCVCLAQNIAQTSVEAAGSSSLPPSFGPMFYLNSSFPAIWYNNDSNSKSVVSEDSSTTVRAIFSRRGSVEFVCGFYCFGSCIYYLLSVAIIGGGNHSVVWSANVGHPVKEGETLQLIVDGELVLRNSDRGHVWSTNTLGKSMVGMNMTEWGNLVLFNNRGAIVWQSFDYPTNTLLVGQRLYKDQKLISSSSNLWACGLYFATLKLATGFATYIGGNGHPQMYYQLVPVQTSTTSRGSYYAELQQSFSGTTIMFEMRIVISHPLYLQLEKGKSQTTVSHLQHLSKSNVPDTSPPASLSRNRRNLKPIIAGSCAGALLIFVVIIVTCFVMLRPSCSEDGEDCMIQVPGSLVRFSYEQLCAATEDFKERLGGGAFGSVFKGMLEDGTQIVAKRLDKLGQGMKEFFAEVETLGHIHHVNLVRLIGFCADTYKYMSNGSLDNWIFWNNQRPCLNCQARKKIILHIAKGLAYLHEECRQRIIHLDIKPQNILLDEDFNAKISDFELYKLITRDESHVLITMRGTPGYIAPEWWQARVTIKTDIYSSGIVLLEIVSGRRNFDSMQSESRKHLLQVLREKAEYQLIDVVENMDEGVKQYHA